MVFKVRSSSISVDHLRHSLAAADHGSFRQAAEVLRIKQPTLSRSIKDLEDRIGAQLFDGSTGGVSATPIGLMFLKIARSILIQMDDLAEIVRRNQLGANDRLTIGFYTSLSTGNLRATLIDFKQKFPHVELSLVERTREELLIALRNTTADIVILAGETRTLEHTRTLSLWSERILVALPQGHILVDREMIYWTDLRTERLLLSIGVQI